MRIGIPQQTEGALKDTDAAIASVQSAAAEHHHLPVRIHSALNPGVRQVRVEVEAKLFLGAR